MSRHTPPTSSEVTVCTVHYRSPRLLEAQLSRLRRHGWPAAVLVLDNGSPTEEGSEMRAIAIAHGARFGVAPKRVSHGLGLDLLAGRVKTPWFLALDSDAWPICDGWLAKFSAHVQSSAVLAGPRCVRTPDRDPARAFAEPYCMLVDVDWYRTSGARCADRWPEWDTAEELSIRAKANHKPISWIPVAPATPWHGEIAASAVFHAWYATRIDTVSSEFLSTVDGLDVAKHRTNLEALLASETAWAAGQGTDPWEKIRTP
jgi:hypothetical protein